MSELDPWPAGQLSHARTQTATAVAAVLAGIGTTAGGATLAVLDMVVLGLVVALGGMVVMVVGFGLAGRYVDGNGPTEAEALFHAHHRLGGWRPTGRRPGEPTGRPAGGSTKSNTTLSPSSFPTLPGKVGPEGAA